MTQTLIILNRDKNEFSTLTPSFQSFFTNLSRGVSNSSNTKTFLNRKDYDKTMKGVESEGEMNWVRTPTKPQLRAFSVRIPEEQYIRILKVVKEQGYGTVVEFIREAIREKLERMEHGEPINQTVKRSTIGVRDLSMLSEKLEKVFESIGSLVETLETLSDKKLMESIKRDRKNVEEGRVKNFGEVLRDLKA